MANAAYADEIDQLDLAAPRPAPCANLPAAAPKTRTVVPRRSAVKSDTGSILGAIMQAASNAAIDADKVERLMGMYQTIRAEEAKRAYRAALPAMQAALPMIDQNGRIEIKKNDVVIQSTPYAKWEDINAAIQPVLVQHGFGLFFRPGTAADGKVTVTAIVTHVEGHQEEATVTLAHDSTGSKNSVQAVGSTLSYGQRYAARALLNFQSRAPADRDDDGAAADAPLPIATSQLDEVRTLIDETSTDIRKFCEHFKIAAVADLRAADYGRAITMLNAKRKAS